MTARNHYFPAHGRLVADTEQRFAAMSDFIAEWQTLAAFPSEGVPGTDYVVFCQISYARLARSQGIAKSPL